jgi:hypothetical protein
VVVVTVLVGTEVTVLVRVTIVSVMVLPGTVTVLVDVVVVSTVDVGIDRHEQADEIKLSAKMRSGAGTAGLGGVLGSLMAIARFPGAGPSVTVDVTIDVAVEVLVL